MTMTLDGTMAMQGDLTLVSVSYVLRMCCFCVTLVAAMTTALAVLTAALACVHDATCNSLKCPGVLSAAC
jgi:hypothetical protein